MGVTQSLEWRNLVYYFIGFYVMLFLFSTPVTEKPTCVSRISKQSVRDKTARIDWLKSEIALLQDELKSIEEELQEPVSPSSLREWIKHEIREQMHSKQDE